MWVAANFNHLSVIYISDRFPKENMHEQHFQEAKNYLVHVSMVSYCRDELQGKRVKIYIKKKNAGARKNKKVGWHNWLMWTFYAKIEIMIGGFKNLSKYER